MDMQIIYEWGIMMKCIKLIFFMILITVSLVACNNNSVDKNTLEIYLVSDELPQSENIDINSLTLEKTPLLTLDDIQKYYWEKQVFITKEGLLLERLSEFDKVAVSVYGLPYVLVVNDERIYMGKLWSGLSSVWPYSPSITIDMPFPVATDGMEYDLQPDQQLYCVYWDNKATDTEHMVFDERIYEALNEKGLLCEIGNEISPN